MSDAGKPKTQLIRELEEARDHVAGLEQAIQKGFADSGYWEEEGRSEFAKIARMMGDISAATPNNRNVRAEVGRVGDLTARIADTSPVGIVHVDRSGAVVFANRKAEEILGLMRSEIAARVYNDPEWKITDNDGNPFPDEQLPFNAVKSSRAAVSDVHHAIEWPDGRRVFLSINASPLVSAHGDFDGMVATIEDISERKEAEEDRSRLTAILESTSDLVSTATPDSQLMYLNAAGHRMAGWGQDEDVEERRISDLHPGWALEIIEREGLATALRDGVWQGESAVLQRDGSEIPVSQVILSHKSEDGTLLYFSTIMRDMTEEKRIEKELGESERMFRALFEQAGDYILILGIDEEGGLFISDANDAACSIHGYARDEFIGTAVSDFDRGLEREEYQELMDQVLSGDLILFETTHVKKDGTEFPIEVSAKLLDVEGDSPLILSIERDMTQRKKAEQALRESEGTFASIFRASPMGIHIYEMDSDDRLVFTAANPAADALTGVANSELFGKTIEEAFPPLAETEVPDRYRRAAARSESWFTEQVDYDHGGIAGAFEVYVFPMSPGKAAVLFNNITERKRAEEERARLREQLAQAQKMESVGRLAGGVAHDFNNMLGVILGHTEMALGRVETGGELYADLEAIHQATERSADLTRQLLAFARKQTVAPKVLDLNTTIEGMLKMLGRLIGEDIDLSWHPGAELGMVRMDPSQIDQILANLTVNARDAIAGVGKITIETKNIHLDEFFCAEHPGSEPGEHVQVVVIDDGHGMDQETLDHLFEPFYTTKGMGEGTGLGLATVYGIVTQNNGFIDVQSEPERGTTFAVYLPRHTTGEKPSPEESPTRAEVTGRETILLVEDQPALLGMISTTLEGLGYSVLSASTPGEAISLARGNPGDIHLLVTDVVMPEMNGRDLAKNILSIFPHVKRLFMSGYTADVIAHQGVLNEGMHFLQKPFSIKDLGAKVREVLEEDG